MGYNFTAIEKKWQAHWLTNKTFRALEPDEAGAMEKAYVLDMFPYPSGAGLHVGHPVGYMATDIVSRYLRMKGFNVLHPMGWDAFGLPAEQYAIKNNSHPRIETEKNIANFRRQIQMLGLGYDWDREINTTDPKYYRWTQWIFLQLFNSYFDPIQQKAMPIEHLQRELFNENLLVAPDGSVVLNPGQEGLQEVSGDVRVERLWRELRPDEQRDFIDGQRLAYIDEAPVNWCPGLGTVLSNEEVIDGKSEVGGFPVERRPMRQWMLRITAYADRLLTDLEKLDWPESLKEMQRNWIGRSLGAEIDFAVAASTDPDEAVFSVFTTRPDTLYGATYVVLAPEHPLVDSITPDSHRETIEAYRQEVAAKSERERQIDVGEKTGVFTGAFAVHPLTGENLPIFIADYVLMGYGTGAIMAVPAHDERDYEFAVKFKLPMRVVLGPADGSAPPVGAAFTKDGIAVNSPGLTGLATEDAKRKMIEFLEEKEIGHGSVQFKLRDWLFSRQRYWGEPFPIVFDEEQNPHAVPESQLPVELPELTDFRPTGTPEPPLSKAKDWVTVIIDGKKFTRETNTMPQWAGSCWYYLRYLDPDNDRRFVDPGRERYWMPVGLYIGGVEHAVLHLLYARFWHKVLFDLGHVSTSEPFARLVNQGLILGEMEHWAHKIGDRWVNKQEAGSVELVRVEEEQTELRGGLRFIRNTDVRVESQAFKMSKSRGNVVNPDEIVRDYGADTFRLYEMYMGPLEAQKPWNTRDIVGMSRFLNSVWRNFVGEEDKPHLRLSDEPIPDPLDRQMHRTIKKVADDIASLRFNTAIAELIKLNNAMTGMTGIPLELAENFILMLAPFAPHIAEELWERLGHHRSLAQRPWPTYDQAKLVESTMELPVQVNGKLRDKIVVAQDAGEESILELAAAAEKVRPWLSGKTLRKKLYVPKKLVNFVVS
jgi:leucyl-tRNA synthetase